MRTSKSHSQSGEQESLRVWGEAFRKQYANHERIGCVGKDILRRLATDPKGFRRDPCAESTLKHLDRCAPCVDEIGAVRRKALARKQLWVVFSILTVIGVAITIFEIVIWK